MILSYPLGLAKDPTGMTRSFGAWRLWVEILSFLREIRFIRGGPKLGYGSELKPSPNFAFFAQNLAKMPKLPKYHSK
jgi:hypothetical protein